MRILVRALVAVIALATPLVQAAITNVLVGFIYQSGIPMVLPSSGSFANNGALSGLTALPATYANAYLFFPANAICTAGTGGNTAGFYFTQMSSATAGTVFNNTYTSGKPTIPASPTAFVCTGPGAYTQVLTVQTLISFPLSGGFLGIQGRFEMYDLWSVNNSANNKILTTALGASNIQTQTLTTSASFAALQWVTNRGVQNAQVLSPPGAAVPAASATANTFLAIDTSVNQNITATGQLAVATDFIVLESMTITGYPQYN